MSLNLFELSECRDCGLVLQNAEHRRTHVCYGADTDFDARVRQFLKRWLWSTESKDVVEKELRELIELALVDVGRGSK